jgi:hypothetical protein
MADEWVARKPRHLYVFGDGASVFKIGRSFNPVYRGPEHREWYRQHFGTERELELLHVEHDAGEIEREVHSRLSGYLFDQSLPARMDARVGDHEWFKLGDADNSLELILGKVAEVKEERGLSDRPPSDSFYTYGCRCRGCRDAHAAASRKRQQAMRDGVWTDGRKSMAPQPAASVAQPVVAAQESPADPSGNPPDTEAVSVDERAAALSDDAVVVLRYLNTAVDLQTKTVSAARVSNISLMSFVTHLPPERCQAGVDGLIEKGRLVGDGADRYLVRGC